MLAYLVNFIHAFIPVSVVVGMLIALRPPGPMGFRGRRPLVLALLCGVLAGAAVFLAALHQGALTSTRTWLHAVALVGALLSGAALLLPVRGNGGLATAAQGAALFFTVLLAAAGSYRFGSFIMEHSLTTSTVLNTELILNLGGILAGLALT